MKISWQKIVLAISVAAVFVFLAAHPILTGNASLCATLKSGSITKQVFLEKEPYTVYKEVDEPYNYIISYELTGSNFYDYLYRKFGKLEIKNIDEHSGIFTVIGIFTEGSKEEKQTLSYEIPPEKSKLFYFEYFDKYRDTDKANFTYQVIPPTRKVQKQITEYKEVGKTKEIEMPLKVSCLF